MYFDKNPDTFTVTINSANSGLQPVNIIFEWGDNGNRLDFGFPNLYRLHPDNVDNLTDWWEQQAEGNTMLPVQHDPASRLNKINAINNQQSASGKRLNFHIPLIPV